MSKQQHNVTKKRWRKQKQSQCNQEKEEKPGYQRQVNEKMKAKMGDLRYSIQGTKMGKQKSEEVLKAETVKMQDNIKDVKVSDLEEMTVSKEEKQQQKEGMGRMEETIPNLKANHSSMETVSKLENRKQEDEMTEAQGMIQHLQLDSLVQAAGMTQMKKLIK